MIKITYPMRFELEFIFSQGIYPWHALHFFFLEK